jgi:hypothetical protein
MNRENIEAAWPEIAFKLKSRFSKLTNADLEFVHGKQDEMLNRIQTRINKTRNELLSLIATL